MSKNFIDMIFNSKDTKNSLYSIMNPRLLYYSDKTENIILSTYELVLLEYKNRCIDFKNYLSLKKSTFNSYYLYRDCQNPCGIKHPKFFSKALERHLKGRLKTNIFRRLIVRI